MNREIKLAAIAGIIGPVLFGATVTVLTIVEADFMRTLGWAPLGGTTTDWPSGLALGPYGRVMTAAFLEMGMAVILFAVGLGRTLPSTKIARVAVRLLGVAGLAMLALAFTTDPTVRTTPATWHGLIHEVAFIALGCALFPAMLTLGWVFRTAAEWSGLSRYTWVTVALSVPAFAVKGVAFYGFLGAVIIWTVMVALRLGQVEKGVPP